MKKIIFISISITACLFSSNQLLAQATNKIDSVGNVGIGTTNLTAGKLVVHGAYPQLILNNPTYGAGALTLWQDNGVNAGAIGHMNTTMALQLSGINGTTPHMTILSGGNVGIGTTAPQNKLQILSGGSVLSFESFYGSSDNKKWDWDFGAGNDLNFRAVNDAYSFATTYLNVVRSGLTVSNVNFPTGNVGIGTISPSEKLSVNGNISSKKSIVTQTGWSDYVFNDDYKLKPLSEVSKFIKDNKHLPEVPNAKEVEEKGLDLGENLAVLLKKIEELTLYLIEQSEKINYLISQNQLQQQYINILKKRINNEKHSNF